MIVKTPEPPYYAVIFTSTLKEAIHGYEEANARIWEIALQQQGFIGMESARSEVGVSVSYWKDYEAIEAWRNNIHHTAAKDQGIREWYSTYKVRISKVEEEY